MIKRKKDCRQCINFVQDERAGFCSWRNLYLKLFTNETDGSRYFNICKDFQYKTQGDTRYGYRTYNRQLDKRSGDKVERSSISGACCGRSYLQEMGKHNSRTNYREADIDGWVDNP